MLSKAITARAVAAILAVALFATGAYATNGMDLEGYGPISVGMGAHHSRSSTAPPRS